MRAVHDVYLVPGFFGFANLGKLTYFGHIRPLLVQGAAARGITARVHVVKTNPTASLTKRAARVAETVLSGGMSSRLFTEVREKLGLAYHVATQYQSLKDHAGMFTYAGTRPDLAQQTFNVTVREIRRLGEGIDHDEMARARTQLKSGLVMQGESTSARAGALASDWYHLGRVRSLEEICGAIDAVTVEDVLAYWRDWAPRDFTVLVIGPQPVDTGAING